MSWEALVRSRQVVDARPPSTGVGRTHRSQFGVSPFLGRVSATGRVCGSPPPSFRRCGRGRTEGSRLGRLSLERRDGSYCRRSVPE